MPDPESHVLPMLHQMIRPKPDLPPPITSLRGLRIALERASALSGQMPVTVAEIGIDEVETDTLGPALGESMMMVALERAGQLVGVAACDQDLRSALVEMRTMGRIHSKSPQEREVTAADIALSRRFLGACLEQIAKETKETELENWVRGVRTDRQIETTRALPIFLMNGKQRVIRYTLDLGTDGRRGVLVFALPPVPMDNTQHRSAKDWNLADGVLGANAVVNAVLHRMRFSLSQVEEFKVGQLLPLDGASVATVSLVGTDGTDLGQGRLGQMAGKRAVRLEPVPLPDIAEADIPVSLSAPQTSEVETSEHPSGVVVSDAPVKGELALDEGFDTGNQTGEVVAGLCRSSDDVFGGELSSLAEGPDD